jgi:4-hydroxy-tetrahydrodipicolinate synthase
LPILAMGGQGAIGVLPNIMPRETIALVQAARAGDLPKARELHYRLAPLMRTLFLETNPIGIKAAMALLGQCENELRLPLTPLSEGHVKTLRAALSGVGLC